MNLFVKKNLERKLKKKMKKKSGEINPLHCLSRLIQNEHFNWISFYASEKWLGFDENDVLKMIKDMIYAFDDF